MKESFSILPSTSIRNHQTNNSTSKNAYAFSKTKRFPQPNPECKVTFYQEEYSEISHRKTSFGYGSKSDFTKRNSPSVSPSNYQIQSCFDLSKTKGKSFGTAREKIPDRSYIMPQLRRLPGPGQYEHGKQTFSPVKFSMRPKPLDFIEQKLTYKNSPGPGAYQPTNMQPKNGRFSLSKFGDAKFGKIEGNRARFQKNLFQTPSSTEYQEKDGINGNSKYVLSKNKGAGTRAFSNSKRLTFMNDSEKRSKNYPGPGNYDKPSDFGIYGTSDQL